MHTSLFLCVEMGGNLNASRSIVLACYCMSAVLQFWEQFQGASAFGICVLSFSRYSTEHRLCC